MDQSAEMKKMIIVLIFWKIKPDQVDDFLNFWREQATIQNRSGLFGEFLSRVEDEERFDFITWIQQPKDESFVAYINVGVWPIEEAFRDQVGNYFNDDGELKPFEHERRIRTVVRPQHWRLGSAQLPMTEDSEGVQ